MPPSDRAGQPATPADLVDVPRLVTAYYAEHPDVSVPEQRVAFGTSGHRGSTSPAARGTPPWTAPVAVPLLFVTAAVHKITRLVLLILV